MGTCIEGATYAAAVEREKEQAYEHTITVSNLVHFIAHFILINRFVFFSSPYPRLAPPFSPPPPNPPSRHPPQRLTFHVPPSRHPHLLRAFPMPDP